MCSLVLLTKALRRGKSRTVSAHNVVRALDLYGDVAFHLVQRLELLAVLRVERNGLAGVEKMNNIKKCRQLRFTG